MRKAFLFRFFEEENLYDEDKINSRIAEFEKKHGVKEERKLRKEAGQVDELYGIIRNNLIVFCVFS